MNKSMQIARISILDKDNSEWFEAFEIRNLLNMVLGSYPGTFEVKVQ